MIEYLPLKRITAMYADEIHEAVSRVVDSGWYLRGEVTARFEEHYANYIGTRHCVGVANGLDALTLILRAYKELGRLHDGDEIVVPANTYIATILSITENRLVPVLVEPRLDTFQIDDRLIEQAITPKTRALMLVHLYGRCAYTDNIADLCQKHHLLLIEDNAQAHGCIAPSAVSVPSVGYAAAIPQPRTGSLGHAAAHSFYPTKNVGALGDAGAVTTDDADLAETVRALANYGSAEKYVFDYIGRNSRLDEIQAAILDVKLSHLDDDNRCRREIAAYYINNVDCCSVTLPALSESVWHVFPVLSPRRDELQQYLAEGGIQTAVHYPIPPHRQQCYAAWNRLSFPVTEQIHQQELSLPCHPAMMQEEIDRVVTLLNAFGR